LALVISLVPFWQEQKPSPPQVSGLTFLSAIDDILISFIQMQLNYVLKSVYYVKGLGFQAQNRAGRRLDKVFQVKVFVCIELDQSALFGFPQFTHSAHNCNSHGFSEIAQFIRSIVYQQRSSAAGHNIGVFACRTWSSKDKALKVICYCKSNEARIRPVFFLRRQNPNTLLVK
jgi:hypothetical protein